MPGHWDDRRALILLELITGFGWWLLSPSSQAAQFGMLLIGVNLFSTAFLQAPLHVRLMQGRDERTIDHLVWTNWVRTITWTVRAGIVGLALANI